MKQKLKKRKDGRYACRYHNQWFYSYDPDDCLKQREDFKQKEREGLIMAYFVQEYALNWLDRSMILSVYDSVTDERDETEAKRLKESLTTELTTDP